MFTKGYTFLLVIIAFMTGMGDNTSYEEYIKLNRNALSYILNSVQNGGSEGLTIKKQESPSKELLAYKYLTQYFHENSIEGANKDYGLILILGIVLCAFFANNSIYKNQLWRSTVF